MTLRTILGFFFPRFVLLRSLPRESLAPHRAAIPQQLLNVIPGRLSSPSRFFRLPVSQARIVTGELFVGVSLKFRCGEV